ncbi:hypothetical protein ACLI08_07940 [Flavobacterium sp. RNTU_13]|uniref:hypothetical protein n=1 Tax=Flavobacterium sp. RNTU_13 TaxID=3375145 RepID=UPI0039879EDC
MSEFTFNKVYVIESLDDNERHTGTELYNDLLRWKEFQIADFKADLVLIKTKEEFHEQLSKINDECANNGFYPIIHFEIHGSKDQNGLVLKSGELVTWEDLSDELRLINTTIGNNLFVTLAVCYGAFLMRMIKLSEPSPFWGILGSFDEINLSDILIRYNEFYNDFLRDFDLNKAIDRLHNSNNEILSTYNFINSEQTFIQAQQKYFLEKFSEDEIENRFKNGLEQEGIEIKSEKLYNELRNKFKEKLLNSREDYFYKHREKFFMLDKFTENRNRFMVTFDDVQPE